MTCKIETNDKIGFTKQILVPIISTISLFTFMTLTSLSV